jgi:histidyl-tRNA synthetase
MGVDRIVLVLEEQKAQIPSLSPLEVYIAVIGEKAVSTAVKMVTELRRNDVSAEMEYAGRSLRAQMKTADKINAQNVIFLGEDEISKGIVSVRDMKSGEQEEVSIEQLVGYLK